MYKARSDRSDEETPILLMDWEKVEHNTPVLLEDQLFEKVRDIIENDDDDEEGKDIFGRPLLPPPELPRSKNKTQRKPQRKTQNKTKHKTI